MPDNNDFLGPGITLSSETNEVKDYILLTEYLS